MIAFLGAGRLAEALIRGGLQAGALRREELLTSCRRPERAEELRALGLRVMRDSAELAGASLIVLGVRHADLPALLADVGPQIQGKLLVSLVVGVPSALIEAAAPGARVVRAIPNTPVSLRRGVTAMSAGARATAADLASARRLFEAVGEVVEVPEAALDAANALSGAGPAWLYAFARALESAGVAGGVEAGVARRLVVHTLAGAAAMLAQGKSPGELIAEVAGPGGSTRAGLDALERAGLERVVAGAFSAAVARAEARNAESTVRMRAVRRGP